MMKHLLLAILFLAAESTVLGQQPQAADSAWPQWRGPTRDGIAPPGPKLLDSWPKEGPKLLWKSDPIPSGSKGGCGSVVVSGGRAFLLVNSKNPRKMMVTTKDLQDLGWRDDLPNDLVQKIEKARLAEKVHYINSKQLPKVRFMQGEELESYIKKFTATLDPAVVQKFGAYIEMRLKQGPNVGADWASLTKLAAIRDKEFSSFDELDRKLEGGLSAWHGGPMMGMVRPLVMARRFDYVDTVICLDAASGKELWRQVFPGVPTTHMDIGASSTPAICDGKCYVAGGAGFYCLSVNDGKVVWQAKSKFSNSSPLAAHGTVYAFVPELTAYDAATGRVRWASDKKMANDSASVAPWTCGNKSYLIGCGSCMDPADGKVFWKAADWGASTPVFASGDTMVVLGNSVTTALRITPDKAEMLWKTKNPGDPRESSPIVYRDAVYVAAACYSPNPVRCFDLKTGAVKWEPKGLFGMCQTASPILADGKIIASVNEEGHQHCSTIMFRATPEKYEELGRFNPHTATCTSPALVGGKLFLRLEDCVACYDLLAR